MGNLPALLPNATSLVSRFFGEMSKKRQRCAVVNLENNFTISAKFTVVVGNLCGVILAGCVKKLI
jgi:hypothetical protein